MWIIIIFFTIYKNEWNNLLASRDVVLNRAKYYYKNDKEESSDKYRNLSEEGQNKKRQYGRNRHEKWKIWIITIFLLYIKTSETTY